jgi:uncharacterized protein (TIGR02118 family)
MVKRISLVWRRPEIDAATFKALWLGEHVDLARKLPGLREYTIDFATDAPLGAPDGVATVRFETREALDAAFNTPGLKEALLETRETFAERVEVLFVEEAIVVSARREAA